MPGMDGTQVPRTLKGIVPALPVFLFTVYGDFPDKLADITGADGCFVKSGDLSPLIQALDRAVRRKNPELRD